MSRLRLALLAALALAAACSDDPAQGTTELASSTTGGSSGAPTTGAPTTSTTTGDDTTSTSGDEAPALEYARGLRLTRVTINQGVQMEIVRDGLEVPAEELTTRLLAGRKTVMRADWLLHADFTPRTLVGRLTLWTPDGETRVDEFTTTVAGPSSDSDLFTTFSWELPAELLGPGLQYRIEALEPDLALATGEVSDPPPVLPLSGRGSLHVQDSPMEIKVVLVPLQHVFGGMTCTPEITDADVDAMRMWMEQHNPVERAILSVHAPLEYTESIGTDPNGFVSLLMAVAALRAQEKPAANLYYYGLIQSCDGYPPGLLGQAYGIPDAPSKGNAWQRIAVGRYQGSGEAARDTFVHEIGHTQGLYHIRCSGGEAGADPDYPFPNGRIGAWGYGIHDNLMRSPTGYRDYMSYCPQSWVSPFGWEKTFDTVAALTSWDAAGPASGGEDIGPIVVGALTSDGGSRWYTTVGAVPAGGRAAGTVVEFATTAGLVRAPASALRIPDSDALAVVAALPAAPIEALTFKTGGTTRAHAPAARVVQLH